MSTKSSRFRETASTSALTACDIKVESEAHIHRTPLCHVLWGLIVKACSRRWSTRGILYLTNLRLVFVAKQADTVSGMLWTAGPGAQNCRSAHSKKSKIHFMVDLHAGLVAFELPLAYIRKDKFNQPIFACNNLSGKLSIAVPHPSDLEAIAGTMAFPKCRGVLACCSRRWSTGQLATSCVFLVFQRGRCRDFSATIFSLC